MLAPDSETLPPDFPQDPFLKVLLADDDPLSRLILTKLLAGKVDLRLASDGAAAWEEYQRDQPDLLLSDWMMPGMNGLELCRRVKASGSFCYVVLITAREELDDKVGALDCGADEYLVKPVNPRELWARIRAGSRIVAAHRHLAAENRTDGLTLLKNRRAFEEEISYEMDVADRTGKPFCLVLGDVNRFKAINDQYGHQVGDRVLVSVGAAMTETLRKVDLVFRLGGDEFAALLPDCPLRGGELCVSRLEAAVAALRFPEIEGTVTTSFGLAVFEPRIPMTVEELMREADEQMYQAKRTVHEIR